MSNYNEYGKVAIIVAQAKGNPKDNWLTEVKKTFFDSVSSQKKSCPKSAFLGLCEEGLVKGIPQGNYTTSVKNKEYAIRAIVILKNNPKTTYTPKELWGKVKKELFIEQSYNSQMDVVLSLWNEGLIVK